MGFVLWIQKFFIVDLILIIITLSVALSIRYSSLDTNAPLIILPSDPVSVAYESISYTIICITNFVIGPFVILFFYMSVRFDYKIFDLLYSYFFAITLTMLVTSIVGKSIRRPKPDTLSLCQGDGSILACSQYLSKSQIVQQFNSFPSYHTAEIMASAVFISLLFHYMTKSFSLLGAIFMVFPILFAIFVAVTRICDRQADISDVVAGMFIGGMMAVICFKNFKKSMKIMSQAEKRKLTVEQSASTVPRYV